MSSSRCDNRLHCSAIANEEVAKRRAGRVWIALVRASKLSWLTLCYSRVQSRSLVPDSLNADRMCGYF
jgi:hypothetical protein